MAADYERGIAAERERIRRLVSRTAAYWAGQAGVSIDALESWLARGMLEEERPRAKKGKRWMIQNAAVLIGLLEAIDSGREAPDVE